VQFTSRPFIDEAIRMVNNPDVSLVAEPTVTCAEYLTVRYRPHFIFANVGKFNQSKLSFINDYRFSDQLNVRSPHSDGGAGLLLSHYHNNNPTEYRATNFIPPMWLRHLRFDFTDMGIETYNLHYPNSPDFRQVVKNIRKQIDGYPC
ncbi:hypothetical protein LCGC14_2385660, partial [marine sediment metagenome]